MKSTMGMSVSEKVFEERFKDKVEEDSIRITYTPGKLRGKIDPEKKKFHLFVAGNGPENFTTVIAGSYDNKGITYNFTFPKATKIMLCIAVVFWIVFSIIATKLYGAIGIIALAGIPLMMAPMFKKDNKPKEKLEKQLRVLVAPAPEETKEETSNE